MSREGCGSREAVSVPEGSGSITEGPARWLPPSSLAASTVGGFLLISGGMGQGEPRSLV